MCIEEKAPIKDDEQWQYLTSDCTRPYGNILTRFKIKKELYNKEVDLMLAKAHANFLNEIEANLNNQNPASPC